MILADMGARPSPALCKSSEEQMMFILEYVSPPEPLWLHLQPALHMMQMFQQGLFQQGKIEMATDLLTSSS